VNPIPESEPPTPSPLPPPLPATAEHAVWRKILWIVSATAVIAPTAWLFSLFIFELARASFGAVPQAPILAAVPALIATAVVTRLGLRRGWHQRNATLGGWSIAAAAVLTLGVPAFRSFQKVRHSSQEKAVMSNLHGLESAVDQFFLENPYRLFVGYDELIGPQCYLKAVNAVTGEDYHVFFPIRRDDNETRTITLPDGRSVNWRGPPVVWPDGVHTTDQPDGSRLETTWLHGVPDGPFHAYRGDGKIWGEAIYQRGRLTAPAWNYSIEGSRFDELDPAQNPTTAARRKLATRDFAGALSELDRAVELTPQDPQLLRDRAAARLGLREFDAAMADLQRAWAKYKEMRLTDTVDSLDDQIARIVLQRAQVRKTGGDAPGAAEDYRTTRAWVLEQASARFYRHDYSGAVAFYSRAIEIQPDLPTYRARAEARRRGSDLEGAIVDYTAIIKLEPDLVTYRARAEARRSIGDFAGAVADFGAVIELDPDQRDYRGRADSRTGLGDFAGAIADFTIAMRLAPAIWESQYRRGYLRRLQGDLTGAADDYRAIIDACRPQSPFQARIAGIWLYFTRCEQGHAGPAAAELAQLSTVLDQAGSSKNEIPGLHELGRSLSALLLGRGTESQMLAKLDLIAAGNDRDDFRFRVVVFSAMARRQAGDLPGALKRFHQALAFPIHHAENYEDIYLSGEALRAVQTAAAKRK
jgi:tetratricopeptide (TPR) repeat protein